jgi:predicted amidohydrolase YtcJ
VRISVFVAVAALGLAACEKAPAPDLVVVGQIHTGVDGTTVAGAVSVKDGKILAVGDAEALVKTADTSTRIIDLNGAHLYPGFTDAHVHLLGVGERELTLNLDTVTSIADLVSRVGKASGESPEGTLIGRGWIETHWPDGRFPTRQDIDAVTKDRPTLLTRADGHALLANTAALEAAGLMGANPAQPDGGRIELDGAGLPTGMLIDNAMQKVAQLVAQESPEFLDKAYETGAKTYAALGWTGGHNMSAPVGDIERINKLSEAGKLPLRIYNAVEGTDPDAFSKMGEAKGGLVITRAIKLYMDGALGSRGALLSAPYSDRSDVTGLQRANEVDTLPILQRALKEGVQVSFHAIGDRGNTLALDWFEQVFSATPEAERKRLDPRWRIEHAQILSATDIPRFAQLGVIPSMQASHAIGDLYFAPARLGDARLDGAYAWRSLIDAGSIIAGGSDAPVEKGDPRIEFYAAVARKDLNAQSGADWRPDQKITRPEALKMFTLWPAFASFREKELGTIEPGKLADFTGFSADILTIPESEILTVEPVLTVVGGAVTFEKAPPAS